jgi:hypothetical protein
MMAEAKLNLFMWTVPVCTGIPACGNSRCDSLQVLAPDLECMWCRVFELQCMLFWSLNERIIASRSRFIAISTDLAHWTTLWMVWYGMWWSCTEEASKQPWPDVNFGLYKIQLPLPLPLSSFIRVFREARSQVHIKSHIREYMLCNFNPSYENVWKLYVLWQAQRVHRRLPLGDAWHWILQIRVSILGDLLLESK